MSIEQTNGAKPRAKKKLPANAAPMDGAYTLAIDGKGWSHAIGLGAGEKIVDALVLSDIPHRASGYGLTARWNSEAELEAMAQSVRDLGIECSVRLTTEPAPSIAATAPVAAPNVEVTITHLALEQLHESPTNPRKSLGDLTDLTESVRVHGVLSPVLARPDGAGGHEIVYGHRRWHAARGAGRATIPTMVRAMSDKEVLEVQVIENLQREDLHPLEEADGFRALHEKHGYALEDLAAKIGKSLTYVRDRLKLTDLGPEGRKAFLAGALALGVAYKVARIPTHARQAQAVREVTATDRDSPDSMGALEAGQWIRDRYMLALADAPFDRGDATLVPGAGVCTTCPKRTGNQPELFGDVKSKDTCTDPDCFASKRDATWARKVAAAKHAGQKVLSEKEAKTVMPYARGDLSYNAPFVDLDATKYDGNHEKKIRTLFGKDLPPVTLARDSSGGIHELVAKKDYERILRAKQPASKSTGSSLASSEKKRREAAKLEGQAVALAFEKIVAGVVRREPNDALWRLIAFGLIEQVWSDVQSKIATRRGLDVKSKGGGLEDQVEKLSGGELRAFVLELAVAHGARYGTHQAGKTPPFKRACEYFKVDLNALLRQVKSEAPKPKTTKSKPKRAAKLEASVRACRACGCTDEHACPGGCTWVAADLCSACEGE